MPKTTIQLPNGTIITVSGATEDIERIIAAASSNVSSSTDRGIRHESKPHLRKRSPAKPSGSAVPARAPDVDLVEIVHLVKTCKESDAIAEHVLDKRGAVNKVLLPLYIIHEHKDNGFGLTSGQISRILKELGIPIDVRNVSTYLSGDARGYVTGDRVRVPGQPVSYKIIRRGVQHFKNFLAGGASGNDK